MRHWLRGGVEDEGERLKDLLLFGVSEAEAKDYLAAQGEPAKAVFGVWLANEAALGLFFRLKRCWRLHPYSGKPVGLDWAQVESKLRLMRVPGKEWPGLHEGLEVCQEVVLGQ